MNRLVIGALALAFFAFGHAATAQAQRLTALGMRGTVTSGSVAVPAESEAVVLSTPPDRPFVLTQVCYDGGGVVLSGSTFGVIPGEMGACTTYHPGIALPRGESLVCQNPNGVVINCMVTGVLTR